MATIPPPDYGDGNCVFIEPEPPLKLFFCLSRLYNKDLLYFTIQMTAIQRTQIIKDPMTIVPPTASILSACSALFMREKFLRALLILFIMCLLL